MTDTKITYFPMLIELNYQVQVPPSLFFVPNPWNIVSYKKKGLQVRFTNFIISGRDFDIAHTYQQQFRRGY
jgi:hypothetical protein